MTDTKYVYEREMEVRDYELDAEGIVNNANYLHYLEHTRHGFCVANGISFAQMQEKGVIPVLNRVEIDYKTPLRSGDRFVSKLWVERKGARFVFVQDRHGRVGGVGCGELRLSFWRQARQRGYACRGV